MISSIIRLPEFSYPGTIIRGMPIIPPLNQLVKTNELYSWGGRDITLHSNMSKYKIRLTDVVRGRVYTIVFITFHDLDLERFRNSSHVEIFPIYVREYPTPGAEMYSYSNLYLFIPGCNRLFEYMGVKQVCSVTGAIYRIIDHLALDSFECLPRYIREKVVSVNWGTTSTDTEDLVDLVSSGMSALDRFERVIDKCCVLEGYFSPEVEHIMRMTHFCQLYPLIDPVHSFDPITIGISSSMPDWSTMFAWIHEVDDSCPRYVLDDPKQNMNRLIYASSFADAFEFKVICEPKHNLNAFGTGFNPLTMRNNTIADFRRTIPIVDAARTQVHLETNMNLTCTLFGDYLEELFVYDDRNELIAYIDLVWWILACGSGLVNQEIFYA